MTHIPYKGSAPGLTALIGGETMIGFTDMLITLPHVKSGRLRALGGNRITAFRTNARLADGRRVGTARLLGYRMVRFARSRRNSIGHHLANQCGNPQRIRHAAVEGAIRRHGCHAVATTPEQFAQFLRVEMAKWSKVVKAAGIRAE